MFFLEFIFIFKKPCPRQLTTSLAPSFPRERIPLPRGRHQGGLLLGSHQPPLLHRWDLEKALIEDRKACAESVEQDSPFNEGSHGSVGLQSSAEAERQWG